MCSEVELREEMYQLIDPGCKIKLVSILNGQLVSFFFPSMSDADMSKLEWRERERW